MKKHFSTIILVLTFIVGLSIMLYPSISNYINEKHQSVAIDSYEQVLQNMQSEDFEKYFIEAKDYNDRLNSEAMGFYDPARVDGYWETFNIDGSGIIGYVSIPKINVLLPFYHGTEENVLQSAAGHFEGSSLPIGGEGYHSVLSAHRGLPSAKLFTNLDKLEVGDRFVLTVLNRILTYEVDQILIVEPQDTDALLSVPGKDYCTLLTCTPYGINTHRMLVRGKRVENEVEKKDIYVPSDAIKIDPIMVTPFMALPFLFVLLLYLLIHYRKK